MYGIFHARATFNFLINMIDNKEKIRLYFITLLVFVSITVATFCQYFGIDIVYTHIFYIPIVLSAIWWQRKAIIIALILGISLITIHTIFRQDISLVSDFLRSLMLLFVAFSVGQVSLMEKNKSLLLKDEQKKLKARQKELKEKNVELDGLLNIKIEFLRVINHQLNTPISIMNLSMQALKDKTVSVKKVIENIESALDRINCTLNDFWLAYSMLGKKAKMDKTDVVLYELLEEIVENKKRSNIVKQKKLAIILEKSERAHVIVRCDKKMIGFVISRLIDNAIYYSKEGRIIASIKSGKKEGLPIIKILISDSGKGISEEDQKKLFKKFTRGTNASLMKPDGSGLSLFIAKKIAQASGGDVILEHTEIDKGSTFSLSLPLEAVKIDSKIN